MVVTYRSHPLPTKLTHWGAGFAALAALSYLAVGALGAVRPELAVPISGARHAGWPLLGVLTGVLVWAMTSARPLGRVGRRLRRIGLRFSILWLKADRTHRLLIAAIIAHVLIGLGYWLEVPWDVRVADEELRLASVSPVRKFRGSWAANAPFWTGRVNDETPPDAEILFRGGWEGMVFSYDVFPRRVFALPDDLQALAERWHKHAWLEMRTDGRSNADAATDRFWTAANRFQPITEAEFIRRYGIDFVVTFDESRPCECGIHPVQEESRKNPETKSP